MILQTLSEGWDLMRADQHLTQKLAKLRDSVPWFRLVDVFWSKEILYQK
jgi:hypothetical protein